MSQVPDILKKIIDVKKEEVAVLKQRPGAASLVEMAGSGPPPRPFLDALRRASERDGRPALIAEVKKASPSKGVIREDFDPVTIASAYERGGATCLSILTDVSFFQGRIDYIGQVLGTVSLPLLRKDFIIDTIQILEARAAGADAILLIAACLDPGELVDLHHQATELGLDVLVEFHDEEEWERVTATGFTPHLCGINNRNLRDFSVSLDITARLAPAIIEAGALLVAESGIFTPADVRELAGHGAKAILVGESLMRQEDVEVATRNLLA
ncbi:MAG: indole-3-glycerol phosphate synthase TrpC [Candidatus Sumerlaeia bacterium]|nr:indole-3-glycerol phosphate synthase TrpC [Candidatus Sumerlaeia bacterium]